MVVFGRPLSMNVLMLLLLILANDYAGPVAGFSQGVAGATCALPEGTVVRREGNAVLEVWELPAASVWFSETLPDSPSYHEYRSAIRAAGAENAKPVLDLVPPKDDSEREIVRSEHHNYALMYSGGGEVRPVRCLEAALFALQNTRASQLTRPTEFIAHILRKDDRLKVYFGASDVMFVPKNVYGVGEVAGDVAAGWQYWVVLHNHPLQALNGKPALGVPAPSTSDVQFLKGFAQRLGLREAWVTNGVFTGVVTSENVSQFRARE
jgi:hypothetical protein